MPSSGDPVPERLEILPVVVVAQAFPARPSALPDVRDFVRRQLTPTSVSDGDVRALCDRVADVLLDVAGERGTIQVSLRLFPGAAEVDVLFAPDHERAPGRTIGTPGTVLRRAEPAADGGARASTYRPMAEAAVADPGAGPASFAAWLSARLRAEHLTMEAAARKLDVSTKTVSRWMNGTTEPRLRDLYRIRDAFGEPPFH